MNLLILKQKTTNKLILNQVEKFNKRNEPVHFEVEKNTELVEKILTTATPSCDNTWPSHIVYTFNSLRNVSNFWRVILNGSTLTKLLTQVYVS